MLGAPVHADGIVGNVELTYSANDGTTTDAEARRSRIFNASLRQRYRLALDRTVFPRLRFSAGGAFEQLHDSQSLSLSSSRWGGQNAGLYAQANWTGDLFHLTAGYNWQMRAVSPTAGRAITELPSLTLSWKPLDLPSLSIRVSRPARYDSLRQTLDYTTDELQVSSGWTPVRNLDFAYSGALSHPDDRVARTESLIGVQSARVGLRLPGRTTIATALTLSHRYTQTLRTTEDGVVPVTLVPVAGLSSVETFPETTQLIELLANPALIDGATETSANVDLGFGAPLRGDTRPRHIGVQFADTENERDAAYIWLGTELPAPVAAGFRWRVFGSDDNRSWVDVPLLASTFSVFAPRFELRFQRNTHRYLKFVVAPLDPAVTTQPDFQQVLVTELECLRLDPLVDSQAQSSFDASLTTVAQTRLTEAFTHDLSLTVSGALRSTIEPQGAYLVTNGLNWSHAPRNGFLVTARVAHTDQNRAGLHVMGLTYGASIAASPLPAAAASVSYGGQTLLETSGWKNTHALSFNGRATPYRGIDLATNASVSVSRAPNGGWQHFELLSVSTGVVPHPRFTATASLAYNNSGPFEPALGRSRTRTVRMEGSSTWTPVESFYLALAGGYSFVSDLKPHPTANVSVGFSPFRGGALQFSLVGSQTVEASGQVTRYLSPGLRWAPRRATLLSVSYTYVASPNPGFVGSVNRGLAANLQVSL